MLKVNEEQKLKAMHTIEHMHVRGRTNIASAISLAAQVANGVKVRCWRWKSIPNKDSTNAYLISFTYLFLKDPNKVRSVFLLTDGNANVGEKQHTLLQYT